MPSPKADSRQSSAQEGIVHFIKFDLHAELAIFSLDGLGVLEQAPVAVPVEGPLPIVERVTRDGKDLKVDKVVDVFGLPPCTPMVDSGSIANKDTSMAEVAAYLLFPLCQRISSKIS